VRRWVTTRREAAALLAERRKAVPVQQAPNFEFYEDLTETSALAPKELPRTYDQLAAILREFRGFVHISNNGDRIEEEFLGLRRDWVGLLKRRYEAENGSGPIEEPVLQSFRAIGKSVEEMIPSYAGVSKISGSNLWTRYAEGFLIACAMNRVVIPWFRTEIKSSCQRVLRQSIDIRRTQTPANWYDCGETLIVIGDWQRKCRFLKIPIDEKEFPKLKRMAHEAITLFWALNEGERIQAYAVVGGRAGSGTKATDAIRQDKAMTSIYQAMRSLLGLKAVKSK
jgi:hypothetical protein